MNELSNDLLEQTDKILDQKKRESKQGNQPNVVHRALTDVKTDNSMRKPQSAWQVDNSYRPFVPAIQSKPHGVCPMPQDIVDAQMETNGQSGVLSYSLSDVKSQDKFTSLSHPYKQEIERFDNSIKAETGPIEAIKYDLLDKTPFLFVDSEETLADLVNHLSASEEIAIDLEAHTMRSYQGLTCLMQVSTRQRDFVVDTMKLRSSLGDALRPIFDDPEKVKVLHGADMDIQWLQRDFGLYIVNMFDTGQAARVLQYRSAGLAHLLQHHCGVLADKKYQLADWRVRPLPAEMLKYAREDTHYLLYIYDCMRKELLETGAKQSPSNPSNLLMLAKHKSNAICLKTYEKHIVKDFNYHMILQRNEAHNSQAQASVLKALLKYRDFVARVNDESAHFVMPNHVMFSLSKHMPATKNEFRDCCRSNMSSLMHKY